MKMKHAVSEELWQTCRAILKEGKTEAEWAEVESDDMYQTDTLEGGFDATEQAFCFSLHEQGTEYWFQITLDDVRRIVDGAMTMVDTRLADEA